MFTVGEITKLLKYSPRRDSLIKQLKSSLSPGTVGFWTLCPTRWTVRADSFQSVIENYVKYSRCSGMRQGT